VQVIEAPHASEHQEQAAVIEWWSYACKGYGLPDFALFSIPNGGHRHKAVAGKLKAEGLRPGVPDLFLAVTRRDAGGLFVEMKSSTGHESKPQINVRRYLSHDYCCAVAYSAEEAIEAIKQYLFERGPMALKQAA
jgi:hypothetical protein